jgi:endonuclease/exonuclease/phosphatase family metal-dependent hydrolase
MLEEVTITVASLKSVVRRGGKASDHAPTWVELSNIATG